MPNLVPGYGPQGFEPSGGGGMGPQEKLADMARLLQGAPNDVLMMIARILQGGSGDAQASQPPQWDRAPMMPPANRFPMLNPEPMRPSMPPTMLPQGGGGFIRG